jgi:hypothetical protein
MIHSVIPRRREKEVVDSSSQSFPAETEGEVFSLFVTVIAFFSPEGEKGMLESRI